MKHLWTLQEARVNELLEACNLDRPDQPITRNTLLVQLERLEAKGWVQRRREERAHVFLPAVPKKEGLRQATREFLDRFFGGALTPLVAHFMEDTPPDRKDLADLRTLLDAAESKMRAGSKESA